MMDFDPLTLGVAGAALLVTLAVGGFWRRRRSGGASSDRTESRRRHEAAREREPPVDLGDVREVGIEEFTEHHTGERRAVGKIEGFVVFVEDVPAEAAVTDVIRVKVLSFNRGHTSATATYVDRA